jgi:hypothetical protein
MDVCRWSAMVSKRVIVTNPNGTLIGSIARECTTTHRNGRYPRTHACRGSDSKTVEHVVFCSKRYPSIAFRDGTDRTWFRTRLSISKNGLFGYNTSAIILYLRICHDYAWDEESVSLDTVGARFGYRHKEHGDRAQDTVSDILKLAED